MSLEELGNLGDFLGGIAVIATLLYLAAQIRQNTSSLKTAGWQSVIAGARESARLRSEPATSVAWREGLESYPEVSIENMTLFQRVIVDEALQFQGVFALSQAGQLEKSPYEAYMRWFASIIATPGGRSWWENEARPIFEPAMMHAVDERLVEGGLPDLIEITDSQLVEPSSA